MDKILRSGGFLLVLLLLAGCGSQSAALPDFLPKAGAVSGWAPGGETRVYNRENLYDMVDGQADAYFVYGFQQVAVQRYQNAAGAILEVAIWQLATPADAYGLFTFGRAGEPAAIGNEGDADPGRRLVFWQDRYWVQVYGRQELPDADLQAFAQAVSTTLPAGGERPALVSRLPEGGLIERGFIFFHEEISIQTDIWLGGTNILDLSPQADGILARYELDGARALLLLIQYPDARAASTGLDALKAGQVDGLVVADARDNLLGAILGDVDPGVATELLAKALGSE
jgi:hypothetical protein